VSHDGSVQCATRHFYSHYSCAHRLGYITDKCLVCPGIGKLVELADVATDLDVADTAQFFALATELNLRDLRTSMGTGGPITLFASIKSGWQHFNDQEMTRLRSQEWAVHRLDLLKNMMVQGAYSAEDLLRLWQEEKGAYNLTTMNGESLVIDYIEEKELLTVGAGLIWVANMEGVDGYLHLTNHTPNPNSLARSLYDLAQEEPDYSHHVEMLDLVVALKIMLQIVGPRTVLYVNNDGWKGKIILSDNLAEIILRDSIFTSLYSCEDFIKLDGQTVQSINDLVWKVSVNDKNRPCFEYANDSTEAVAKVCITRCDMIANNGIAHEIDNVLAAPGVVDAEPPSPQPSMAPSQTFAPTTTRPPTLAPSDELVDFDLVSCMGGLEAADEDGDGAIRRNEYFFFIEKYSESMCLSMGQLLTDEQIELFKSFACQCELEENAPRECCAGTSALIDLSGELILDQTSYRTEICEKTHRNIGGESRCTTEPTSMPTAMPSRVSDVVDDTDKDGNGNLNGGNDTQSGALLVSPVLMLSALLAALLCFV
jgi:uncharacterized surface protein with fasciclin (FAS1) repeats